MPQLATLSTAHHISHSSCVGNVMPSTTFYYVVCNDVSNDNDDNESRAILKAYVQSHRNSCLTWKLFFEMRCYCARLCAVEWAEEKIWVISPLITRHKTRFCLVSKAWSSVYNKVCVYTWWMNSLHTVSNTQIIRALRASVLRSCMIMQSILSPPRRSPRPHNLCVPLFFRVKVH